MPNKIRRACDNFGEEMSDNKSIFNTLLQKLINLIVIVSLILVFLEDFFLYIGMDNRYILIIRFVNFYIDVLFTIEFIIKFVVNTIHKKGLNYFVHHNGWADMFASIPLLIFVSLPFLLNDILHLNFSIIAFEYLISLRILRFFRILKFVGKLNNPKSVMASRHISIINLMVTTSVILFLFIISFLQDIDILDSPYKKMRLNEIEITKNYLSLSQNLDENDFKEILKSSLVNFQKIILIKYKDDVFYNYDINKIDENSRYFYLEDELTGNKFQIVFLRKDLYSEIGFIMILYFSLIFFVILFIDVFYKNYFYMNIIKPLLVMRRGFEDINYTSQVVIPDIYKQDEIFNLANNYNLRWLEAKKRKLKEIKNNGLTLKK